MAAKDEATAYDKVVARLSGLRSTAKSDDPAMDEMRRNRAVNSRMARTASAASGVRSGASIDFATGRPRDPMFYWKQNNIPYDLYDHEELKKVRAYMRLLYQSHPLIGSCVDIYTKYPLLGLELNCFAGETEVITRDGTKTIADLADTEPTLLTTGGQWVQAPVKAMGRQRLLALTVRRNQREKVIYTTAGHRWFVQDTTGPGRGAPGEQNRRARIIWEQVQEIREAYAAGATQVTLAGQYGISQSHVSQIIRETSWQTSGREVAVLEKENPKNREAITSDLQPGDVLASVYARQAIFRTNPSPFGIAHGVTWGDGALATGGGAVVDLYGAKDAALLRFFQGCRTYDYMPDAESETRQRAAVPSVRVTNLPAYFKTLPPLTEGVSYLYGFLAGWFAADGTVTPDGKGAYLDSHNGEAIKYARDLCHRLGIKTTAPYHWTVDKRLPQGTIKEGCEVHRLSIDVDSVTEDFFATEEHRRRWLARGEKRRRENWVVVSVEETDRVEEVYCAVVPGTEAFALEDNILTGNCKDEKLTDFYSDLFLSEEGLNYPEFFIDFGREYWSVGESVPFGSFNETLGVWDDEELLNPDDLEVVRSPFLKEPRYFIKLPQNLREIITKRSPAWEYEQLMAAYPELSHYTAEDALMPVSSILLRHYKFKADTFNKRGVPLTMRSMRAVMQEEMLNAARDAVADRLYTPLVLARLGASATDLGTTQPWIPTPEDLGDFEEALDAALAADFRVLIHHFGVQMDSVFGAENLPDFIPDFEQLEDRMLQTFGLSKTMLTGASSGQTYAADALNRDLVSQLLTTYQNMCKRHYRQRAMVVAEAQEHYDYEERNGKRYVKMEEILEIGEDGSERIIEQPKLLIPEMSMKTMNIKDEEAQREFLEQLRASGVPISMKTRMIHAGIDLDDEVERSKDEQVMLAVAEQETRREIFKAIRDAGLPIPPDLASDFQPRAANVPEPSSMGMRVPMFGVDPVTGQPTLAPTAGDYATPTAGGVVMPGQPATPVDPYQPPGDVGEVGSGVDDSQVPDESNEQREDMPKAASYKGTLEEVPLYRAASRMREITAAHYVGPEEIDESKIRKVTKRVGEGDEAEDVEAGEVLEDGIPRGSYADPKHIGMRRHAFSDASFKDRKGKTRLIDRDTFKPEPEEDKTIRAVS